MTELSPMVDLKMYCLGLLMQTPPRHWRVIMARRTKRNLLCVTVCNESERIGINIGDESPLFNYEEMRMKTLLSDTLKPAEKVIDPLTDELGLEEQFVNPVIMDDKMLYDEDLDSETVKALSHALELDYIEKWKVFAQMKLLERNFAVAEQARIALRDQLIIANANVQILLRNYEEKKIGLDFELSAKLSALEELKELRAENKRVLTGGKKKPKIKEV